MVTDDTLWEVKCVTKLTEEHKNQLVVYAWLYLKKENMTSNIKFKILNLFDGESWELKAKTEKQREGINSAVHSFLNHYLSKENSRMSDEEFVKTCKKQVLARFVAIFSLYYFLWMHRITYCLFFLSLITFTTLDS